MSTESYIQLPQDSSGKKLRTVKETIEGHEVHTQMVQLPPHGTGFHDNTVSKKRMIFSIVFEPLRDSSVLEPAWTDLPYMGTVFDKSKFDKIASIKFRASINMYPSGIIGRVKLRKKLPNGSWEDVVTIESTNGVWDIEYEDVVSADIKDSIPNSLCYLSYSVQVAGSTTISCRRPRIEIEQAE